MSVYIQIELRCDGIGQFGCEPPILASTVAAARREARTGGWLVGQPGGKDYCDEHRPGPRRS
jgi:hypothetical protein